MTNDTKAIKTKPFSSSSSLKRRLSNRRRRHCCPKSMSYTTITHALFLLLIAVWADDSSPPFFVTPQTSPQQAPTLVVVSPEPASLPTTNAPVVAPVARPTARPVTIPTGRPVVTDSPTERPISDPPTAEPIAEPTANPTRTPSAVESLFPSTGPSRSPTVQPSEAPSVPPQPTSVTSRPTISPPPSATPTSSPITRSPQIKPVAQSRPVSKPTTDPSNVQPTTVPTRSPQTTSVRVDVILSGLEGKLADDAQKVFELVTGNFIYDMLLELDYDFDTSIINVQTDTISQEIKTNRRQLQSDSINLQLQYNAIIEYQSDQEPSDLNSDAQEWVYDAFNTDEKRELYTSELQNADGDTFDNVNNIVVFVEGKAPPEGTPIDNKSTNNGLFSNENLWYIIGAVGGTISLIVIISTLYMMGRNKQRRSGKQNMTTATKIKNQLSYDSDSSPTNKLHYTAEIDVDLQNDDVSTLGDPTYYGGAADQPTVAPGPILLQPPPSQCTNSIQKLYHSDARERFLSEDDTDDNIRFSESNLSKHNDDDDIVVHTVIEDSVDHLGGNDDNFTSYSNNNDRFAPATPLMNNNNNNNTAVLKGGVTGSKYAVEVPPGKLGMIIDTPDSGPPVVHTIKPESILCATVQAGDYLISVDGEIVTHMTAVQVSKLISIKSDQQRTLVFLRKPIIRNRINSSSSDYFVEQNGAC